MVWQFGKVGCDFSLNTCADGTTADASCRTADKSIRRDYYQNTSRRHPYDTCRAFIARPRPAWA